MPARQTTVSTGPSPRLTGVPLRPRPRAGRTWPRELLVMVALGCGGMVGAVARYAVSIGLPTQTAGFPWDTFAVNVSGSLLLGIVLAVASELGPGGGLTRSVIGTGVIGAYTTFSTWMVESVLLVRDGATGGAVIYLAASIVAGLLAAWTVTALTRLVVRAGRRHRYRVGRAER